MSLIHSLVVVILLLMKHLNLEIHLKILFYRGTGGADVVDRDITESVKVGDELTVGYSRSLNQPSYLQEQTRGVIEITSSNSVDTNNYNGARCF